MSYQDEVFIKMCTDILETGVSTDNHKTRTKWLDGTPAHTIKKFGIVNRYDLSKEFPALTLRPVPFKNAIDEILWIWQKKSNKTSDLNSQIWDLWKDEDGTIGKAYGYQLGIKYNFGSNRIMDQVDNIIWQLKNTPNSRRMITNIFNFADLKDMGLEPCAYSMSFNVTGNKLNGLLNQRSQDVLTANAWNVLQYSVLLHIFAQISDLKIGEFVHVINDVHIYDRHIDIIEKLIKKDVYPAPKFIINKDKKNFYDFTVDDFVLENYKTGEQIKGFDIAL
ncbi:MAG: thymidylate synthase [Clostridiales Family XIII bacterium]|jgi:thymidylate synthase|nr:thymidylate synthase [Clostridiales Family XIII bacterium]